MGLLETMKTELEIMRHEKMCMEALLTAAETALEENKRVVSMYKAMEKLADDLLDVVLEANNAQELDGETLRELVEEAIKALKEAQSPGISPSDGGIGGGDGDSK